MADEDEGVQTDEGAEAPVATPTKGTEGFDADVRRDKPGVARAILEANVAKGLKALGTDAEDEPDADAEADEPKGASAPEPEAEAEPEPALPGDEGDEDEPYEPDEVAKEQQPKVSKTKGPTFPAAIRRSLLAYGWTDEEIDEASADDKDGKFLATASRIHANRNAELASWAAAGRNARPKTEEPKAKEEKAVSSHVDSKTGLFKPLDVDAMIERHGNEDIVREITGPVNEIITQINAVLPDLLQGVQSIQQSRQDTLARQIDQFFGVKEMEPYADLYGKSSETLTDEQFGTRNKVLDLADALIYGAAQQGKKLSPSEAMTLAHDSVSSEHKAQAVRKEVKATIKKRGASLTLRPGKTVSAAEKSGGKPKTRAQLESVTRQRLAGVFK